MKIIVLYLLLALLNGKSLTEKNPEVYFGREYADAVAFCANHSVEMFSIWDQYNIERNFALALVFPEILRYNMFRDFLETISLEMAYIHGGSDVANFSIGPFQMKPSFAEVVEQQVNNSCLQKKSFFQYPDSFNLVQVRRMRVDRLKSLEWQSHYLAAFICLQEKRFNHIEWENESQRLAIYATAYNYDFNGELNELLNWKDVKYFPYGRRKPNPFSYTTVALHFYHLYADNI